MRTDAGPLRSFLSSRTFLREAAAVTWLFLIAGAFLAPALAHGRFLGPYDILSQFGLTSNPHVGVHNLINSDEIQEFIPWQALAWMQVHAGHLPLWNPHNLLGLPLAFNFQSAPFGPTVALGYLFPLADAHNATVIGRLIVAGSGAYFFARVLRLDILPALLCASIFELSGAMTIFLGDYVTGCMAWSGWVLGCSALIVRGRHRAARVSSFALALAFALLEGEPQIAAVLLSLVVVFALVMVLHAWRSGHRQSAVSIALDHGLGIGAGLALVAPVYLPGIQLGLASSRNVGPLISDLPRYDLLHLLFSSYDGVPTSLGTIIGPDNLYVSMLYVGAIGLVLSITSLALWRQRREVVAFSVAALGLIALLFARPLLAVFRHVPALDVFRIQLATSALDLCVAVLAGFGAQALLSRRGERVVESWFRVGVGAVLTCLVVLGVLTVMNVSHLAPAELSLRRVSFLWPAVGLVACAAVLLVRSRTREESLPDPTPRRQRRPSRFERASRMQLGALLVVETVVLVSAGAGFVSSSSTFLPKNSDIATYQRVVGTSLVGFGTCAPNAFPSAGLVPDINLAYGVHEFAAYDPILPRAYHTSYGHATGTSTQVLVPVGLFCPAINSVALAQLYGVSYILEPGVIPGPPGTRLAASLTGQRLFAVPHSGRATLVALDGRGPAQVQSSSQPTPSTWRVQVHASRTSLLELRVSDVPGWRGMIDGRPLHLATLDSVMLEAVIPPGHHVVTLRYWPKAFSVGIVLAATVGLILLCSLVAGAFRFRRRLSSPSMNDQGH